MIKRFFIVQELDALSQNIADKPQVLEQVLQAGALKQNETSLAQVHEDDTQWMDMEDFAIATGKTQQGISYLINKGRLKEYREEGLRIKKTDKWYIDASLVELVKTEKPLKTLEEKEALNNQLRSTQTALIKYREFEKRIITLEEENERLVEQVEGLQQATEEKIKALQTEKESLAQVVQELSQEFQESTVHKIENLETEKNTLTQLVQQLAQDLEKMKTKPWWQFW
jgi:hypothetical protein